MIGKYLRHGIGAAVGALLGALVATLAGRGITVDPDQVAGAAEALTNALTLFVTVFGYAAAEKFLRRFPWLDRIGYIERMKEKQAVGVATLPLYP